MDFAFVNVSQIAHRWDASYYDPGAARARALLHSSPYPLKPLSQCIKTIFSGPFRSNLLEKEYSENGLVIVRPVNLTTSFDKDNLVTIDPELAKLKGLKEIDRTTLLFARVGDPVVGILPASIPHATLSPNIIAAKAKDEEDLEFLFAFFNTSTAFALLNAAIKRVTQPTIGIADIAELEVLSPSHQLRQAIGNKVRAAEALRQIAAISQQQAAKTLAEDLRWDAKWIGPNSLSTWIQPNEMESRIDGQYNSAGRVAITRHLRTQNIESKPLATIAEISAMIGWKGLTTEHYDSSGPILVRLVDFQDGILDLQNAVHVTRHKYDEQPQIHLRAGDIVLVKDGNGIGTPCIIPEIGGELCAGSTLARVRVLDGIEPYYLKAVLNHEVVQIQIRSIATGLAQPHITQEWISCLQIPLVSRRKDIAKDVQQYHGHLMRAKDLMERAIIDVESMIEGKLDDVACIEDGRELADEFGFDKLSPHRSGGCGYMRNR